MNRALGGVLALALLAAPAAAFAAAAPAAAEANASEAARLTAFLDKEFQEDLKSNRRARPSLEAKRASTG